MAITQCIKNLKQQLNPNINKAKEKHTELSSLITTTNQMDKGQCFPTRATKLKTYMTERRNRKLMHPPGCHPLHVWNLYKSTQTTQYKATTISTINLSRIEQLGDFNCTLINKTQKHFL